MRLPKHGGSFSRRTLDRRLGAAGRLQPGRHAPGWPLEKRDSHLLVATGLSSWGLTGSYLAARLLCRNILGRSQPEARFFLPHRSYAKKFAVMLPGALREAGAMAAMVFHRDMPKCTHMAAACFPPEAQRWECPCHGSAFSILGEVRAAPAAEDASISPRQRRQR